MRTLQSNQIDTADYYYFILNELLINKEAAPLERLLYLREYLNDFLKEFTASEEQFFSNDFARLVFLLDTKFSNKQLSYKIKQLYFYLRGLTKGRLSDDLEDELNESIYLFSEMVYHFTNSPQPQTISELKDDLKYKIINAPGKILPEDKIGFIRTVVISIDKENEALLLEAEDSENIVLFYPRKEWKILIQQCRIGTTLNLINVLKKDDAIHTSHSSLIVVDPDYLFDSTEIAEAFDYTGFNPYRLLLKRIKHHSGSIHLVTGHIINYLFDSLLINPSADFDEVYLDALKSRIMPVFSTVIDDSNNKVILREKASEQFKNLKKVAVSTSFEQVSIEPSFISPRFGFQGRMDLLTEQKDNDLVKDIYELKSGRPARIDERFSKDGAFIKTGTYINHFAQVTVYNMLLETCYPDRKGSSAILYSKDHEYPLRNVPNFKKMKQELIMARNQYLALEYKLAEGDNSIFKMLDADNFPKAPFWVRDDFSEFMEMFVNLSEFQRKYYLIWLKFTANELFAAKLGNGERNRGHSSLWLRSKESKEISGDLISGMKLVPDETDFEAMHLVFSYSYSSDSIAQFKKGDICIIYPDNPDSEFSPRRGRLIKCTIKEMSRDRITISLRNKMQYEIFADAGTEWILDFDSTDSAVKSMYKSISLFINSSDEKKNLILGLNEPQFDSVDYPVPEYLSDEKKEIYNSAMNALDYFLIQGPPGTGKTKYMLRALVEGIHKHTEENILLLAYTNRAVDEICDALKLIELSEETPFEFVRLGSKESSVHKEHLLSELVDSEDLNSLFRKVKRTRVFASTVSFAQTNSELFELKHFHTAIVDEAAQITECNLIGILAQVERFILIGDEKQLPAIVIQDNSKLIVEDEQLNDIDLKNLNVSLFERLISLAGRHERTSALALLNRQARMHADIMEFPNKFFYSDMLEVFNAAKQTIKETRFQAGDGYLSDMLSAQRFIYINTPAEHHSKYNIAEADRVCNLLNTIEIAYGDDFSDRTAGVISPFRMQCATIRKKMTDRQRDLVSVDTVERFQGSERDIIIISMAVNNAYLLSTAQSPVELDGRLIDRKLNVAVTRAKSHVVILGNESILRNSTIYSRLIDFCREKGAYLEL